MSILDSHPAQVEHNRESTARQYALVARAAELAWPQQQVFVIDEDLGVTGSGIVERSGFARLTAEVALGHVGIGRSHAWPVTTPIGTACSISVV